MMQQNGLSQIDQYAMRSIECRVQKLIGSHGIVPDDRDDLVQQLFLEYLERAGGFDSERGCYKTFVNCLIRNQVASLIRARKKERREATLCPLPSLAQDLDEDTAIQSRDVSEDAYRIAIGQASRPAAELLDLRLDVDRALDSLPFQLREIGVRVVEEGIEDASKAIGRSPSRVYQLLWKARATFMALGVVPAVGGVK